MTPIITQDHLMYIAKLSFWGGLAMGVGLGLILGFLVRPYFTPTYPTKITVITNEEEEGQ